VRRLVLLAGASSALLAGCGGASSYHLAATRACLAKAKGVKLTRRVDFVASTASAGAFTVKFARDQLTFARNQVTISFGRDSAEASQLAKGYMRVHGKNIGIEDVLRPQHNAVMLWAAHPSDAQLGTVTGCLK
jgi:D-alanyl-D-alanine dipeptidase